MLRAVLDTNIFVSSLLNKTGTPAKLLDSWKAGEYILITSPPIIKEIKVDEKTLNFLEENKIDPEVALAARLNEACRLLEMGVVKGYEDINEVERIGEHHEGIFVLGWDKYQEWAEKLEAVAEKIGKPYLKPCEMMRSGKFKDYP